MGEDMENNDTDMSGFFHRRCFVTVGATAGFRQLLEEIIQPDFLACLAGHDFATLEVQCGPDADWFHKQVRALRDEERHGVDIFYFQYSNDLKSHMLACRGEAGVRPAGCIISHAGSGTILEANRYGVPLVVVPNPTLMNNHQAELAEEVERLGWGVYGRLGKLAEAIDRSQQHIVEGRLDDLPPYSPPPFPVPELQRTKLFDWVVLTCYPEQLRAAQHLRDLDQVDEEFRLELEVEQQAVAELHQRIQRAGPEVRVEDFTRLLVD